MPAATRAADVECELRAQRVRPGQAPLRGTFRLGFEGHTTAPLSCEATAAEVEAALAKRSRYALDAAFLSELQKEPSSSAEFGASVVAAPPHLYGSLAIIALAVCGSVYVARRRRALKRCLSPPSSLNRLSSAARCSCRATASAP